MVVQDGSRKRMIFMSSCSCNPIHQFEIQTLVKQDKFCMVITWKHYSYWFLNLDSLFFIPRNALGLVKFTAISVGRKWHSKYKKITQEKCSESIFQKIVYIRRASIGVRFFSTMLIIIFWLFFESVHWTIYLNFCLRKSNCCMYSFCECWNRKPIIICLCISYSMSDFVITLIYQAI